jgi:hypothetical protein
MESGLSATLEKEGLAVFFLLILAGVRNLVFLDLPVN